MTPRRFRKFLDIYGADLDRWPPASRGPARALLDSSADMRALMASERGLEAVLDTWKAPARPLSDPAALARAIVNTRGPKPSPGASEWRITFGWPKAAALAAAAVSGFLIGWSGLGTVPGGTGVSGIGGTGVSGIEAGFAAVEEALW